MSIDTTVNIQPIQDKPLELLVADVQSIKTKQLVATLTDEERKKQLDIIIDLYGTKNSTPGLVYWISQKLHNQRWVYTLREYLINYGILVLILSGSAILLVLFLNKGNYIIRMLLIFNSCFIFMSACYVNHKNVHEKELLEALLIGLIVVQIVIMVYLFFRGIFIFIYNNPLHQLMFNGILLILEVSVFIQLVFYPRWRIFYKYVGFIIILPILLLASLWLFFKFNHKLIEFIKLTIPTTKVLAGFLLNCNMSGVLKSLYIMVFSIPLGFALVYYWYYILKNLLRSIDRKWGYLSYFCYSKLILGSTLLYSGIEPLLHSYGITWYDFLPYIQQEQLKLTIGGTIPLITELLVQEYFIDKKLFGEVGEVRST